MMMAAVFIEMEYSRLLEFYFKHKSKLKLKFKMRSLLSALFLLLLFCCKPSTAQNIDNKQNDEKYIFFLHNRFLETNEIDAIHPEYGRVEYKEILQKFKDNGFIALSEKRPTNVNAFDYAQIISRQIDSLLKDNVPAKSITVVGTSKGGYIAQYVSTIANNPDLNFVFIGSFRESDMEQIPDINWCGNVLNIYEMTDPAGISALSRKKASSCEIAHYKDIELNTGLQHGFLFKALDAWMVPAMNWADGDYN